MPLFECDHCTKTFKSKEFRHQHMARYHGYDPVMYKCEKCPKTFKYKQEQVVHMTDFHKQNDIRYECGQCASSFKYHHHLLQHVKFIHDPNKKTYKCNECAKEFQRRDAFAQHMKYVHSHTFTLHRCELCNRIYRSKATLKMHINMNHNENFKRSSCPLCPADFKWPHHLKQHINKVHIQVSVPANNKVQTNRCSLCFIVFRDKLELLMHMRTEHHLDVEIYKCCQCSSVFNMKEPLQRHLEEHDENKVTRGDHKCEQCYPVPSPKLYLENENTVVENIDDVDIRNELVDFEVTIMEDPDLRRLISYKMRHSRKNGTNFLEAPDMSEEIYDERIDGDVSENPHVEFTADEGFGDNTIVTEETNCNNNVALTDDLLQKVLINYRPELEIEVPELLNELSIDINQISPLSNYDYSTNKDGPISAESLIEKETAFIHENMAETNRYQNNDKDRLTSVQLSLMANEKSAQIHENMIENNIHQNIQEQIETVPKPLNSKKLVVKLLRINPKVFKKNIAHKVKNPEKVMDKDKNLVMIKCKICNLKFKKAVDVARHHKHNHTVKPVKIAKSYKCQKCSLVFATVNAVSVHAKKYHKKPKTQSLEKSSSKDVSEKTHKCKHCSLRFAKVYQLSMHSRKYHKEKGVRNTLRTLKCSEKIPKSNQLNETSETSDEISDTFNETSDTFNETSETSNETSETSDETNTNEQSSEKQRNNTHECGKCALFFQSKLQLLRHISSAHMNIKDVNSIKYDNLKHTSTNITFSCASCDQSFTNKITLKKHIKVCQSEKTYKCVACNMTFETDSALTQHLKMQHRHKCGICSIAFVRKEKLIRHLQTQHQGRPKEHKCEMCNAVFRLAASLAKHVDDKHQENTKDPQIVTKEMEKCMHRCSHCGALFPLREALQRHIQLEHDVGSVHKCGECTAVFNDIEEFKEHLQIEHMQESS